MTTRARVLVVDDDRLCRRTTVHQLRAAGHEAEAVSSPFAALPLLESGRWDVVLTDLRMPGMDGLSFLREIRRRQPDVEVMLMTAYGTVESAVEAMRAGAADYLTKPFRFSELELRLRRLCSAHESRKELTRLRGLLGQTSCGGLVGRSAAMRAVCERVAIFAEHRAPVLVTGETGTGKELVARAMHDSGPLREAPFVPVACGAVPRELAESTFLGHEKGAFTGAAHRRKGCFEQADGGTLLLDDVDDLPLDLQVKLLRVLQSGTFARVGGDREVHVDVRVIATTKADLAAEVAAGRFRSDLYYRLRGLELQLPPLRERGDDLLLLAAHFLQVVASQSGRGPASLSPEAVALMRAYDWPGNVRELRRAMEAADALARGGLIEPSHLPPSMATAATAERPYSLHLDALASLSMPELVRHFENDLVSWAMEKAQGQQSRAAELLGLPRTTLQSKLARSED